MNTAENLSSNSNSNSNSETDANDLDYSDYVKKTDLERIYEHRQENIVLSGPDYNPSNYIKKTRNRFTEFLPEMPDLKDYVLKSTIPPVQKCPSCVCPKVNVDAGYVKNVLHLKITVQDQSLVQNSAKR